MTERILTFWVIYKHPKDHPDMYVLRAQHATKDGVEFEPTALVAKTAQALRHHLPPGLVPLGRFEDDDPAIYEVWG